MERSSQQILSKEGLEIAIYYLQSLQSVSSPLSLKDCLKQLILAHMATMEYGFLSMESGNVL